MREAPGNLMEKQRKRIAELEHEIDVQCSSGYVERILKENERLRAALKRIVDYYDSYGECAKVCAEIAREALAAVEDKT